MIVGAPEIFALEHQLLDVIKKDDGDWTFFGSFAIWLSGTRFSAHYWYTEIDYISAGVDYLAQNSFQPDPKFSFTKPIEEMTPSEFSQIIDFYVYGIGQNSENRLSDAEVLFYSTLMKHECNYFENPFSDLFPMYIIEKNGICRIILRERNNGDKLHEISIPRKSLNRILQEWCTHLEKDKIEYIEKWNPKLKSWSRVLNFFCRNSLTFSYDAEWTKNYDFRAWESEERQIWELQDQFVKKYGL